MAYKLSQAVIEQWISLTSGTFSVRDIWAELDIVESENRQYLRVILNRLEEKGVIRKTNAGLYRKLDIELRAIKWQNVDPSKTVAIHLPFGVHHYCKIYPKSIIVLAGEKNEGKTAYLYQAIEMNMTDFEVDLFNSETGPEQMKERFAPLGIPNPAPFHVYERYDSFADVVHPEHLSFIDYLDFNSEVYLVGAEIDAIFRKLTTGVAIIGLQKPPPTVTYTKGGKKQLHSRDLAYGGAFSAKRASLYISLGSHRLKLVYVKSPAQKGVNPNNMQWEYSFDDSGYFTNIKRYYEPYEDA